ncbi:MULTISPECIES: GatB/YqeY domain-containing protein [Euryhalocaulis]|uniref:GatB/YqeY domain-containing protein n=1 Tax=Euryhalocaulis TaxID=1712422 RepID=UPI00039D7CC2|nr:MULTISPECIES: GatB/YqeY domain-containing protein [Euryhalocaulis]MBA4800634.1 GatB/YqeY domain-containing protein [Euryhalocaulis sp.]
MTTLRERIETDLKVAMKAREAVKVSTLRLIQTAIKDRDIAARAEDRCKGCEEEEIMSILSKMVRQREESSKAFEDAGRYELAERERDEMEIIREYMPRQMSDEEISAAAGDVVEELDASGLKDMGRCMGALKERYPGQMDFSKAGAAVKDMLR